MSILLFLQIGDGVDDETWRYHLEQSDFSRWFRQGIKDESLAAAAEGVETRANIHHRGKPCFDRAAIEQHYTLPVAAPLPVPCSS